MAEKETRLKSNISGDRIHYLLVVWYEAEREQRTRLFWGGRGEGKDGDLDKEGERRRINTRASVVVRTSRLSSQCSPRPGATSQPPKKKRK